MGGKSAPVIGYYYDLSVHFIITQGEVDEIIEIIGGERTAWIYDPTAPALPTQASYEAYYDWLGTGFASLTNPPPAAVPAYLFINQGQIAQPERINTDKTIYVSAPEIFGGEKREGGYRGAVTISMGNSEVRNPYLVSQLDENVPAYVGLTTALFRNFNWSAMNPYFKAPWFRVKRIFKYWQKGVWYPEKAQIGDWDMNPAHIIYQSVVEPGWGMNYPTSEIDNVSFTAAADRLYNENFGLSLIWNQDMSIEDFIQIICDHINGSFRLDPRTGKFKLVLIRDDYVVDDLTEIGPSQLVEERSFSRSGLGESANQLTVTYTDRDQNPQSVTVQDLASVTNQGGVIATTRDYPGIREASLATKVAERDLGLFSANLATIDIVTDRTLYLHEKGDVFAYTNPRRGLSKVPFRIIKINKGNLSNGEIEVEAVEDVFGLPTSSYTGVQDSEWQDPSGPPQAPAYKRYDELTYRDFINFIPPENREQVSEGTFAFVKASAISQPGSYINFGVNANATATGLFEEVATGYFCAAGILEEPLGLEYESLLVMSNVVKYDAITVGKYCTVNDEICVVKSKNDIEQTVTVGRGCIDTVPTKHEIGSIVWFNEDDRAIDPIEKYSEPISASGETFHYKIAPKNGYGTYPTLSLVPDLFSVTGRAHRPYAPGQLKINDAIYPEYISGLLNIKWASRSARFQQDKIVDTSMPSTLAEQYVQYSVKVSSELEEFPPKIIEQSGYFNTIESLQTDEFSLGLFDLATDDDIRGVGLVAIDSPLSNVLGTFNAKYIGGMEGITPYPIAFTKVANGWQAYGKFVNSTTGVLNTVVVPDSEFLEFDVIPTVPHFWGELSIQPNPPTFGYATIYFGNPYDGADRNDYYSNKVDMGYPIKDNRRTANHNVYIKQYRKQMHFTATYNTRLKLITRFRTELIVQTTASILANSPLVARVSVDDYYYASNDVLDDAYKADSAASSFLDQIPNNVFKGNKTTSPLLRSEIFDELLYVNYYGKSGTSVSSVGKQVDISKILVTGHINFYSARSLQTKLFRITSAGVITLISSREGFYFAAKLTTGVGVEISHASRVVKTVNSTTGALIATLGTLTYEPLAVYCNQTDQHIYILGNNYTFYKYDNTLTLLDSVVVGEASVTNPSDNLETSYLIGTSAIQESQFNFYLSGGQIIISKNFEQVSFLNNFAFPYNATAEPDSTVFTMANIRAGGNGLLGLVDEAGTSPEVFNGPKPRYTDTLNIELNCYENQIASQQKHEVTVKRAGWGLRWDECWDGVY